MSPGPAIGVFHLARVCLLAAWLCTFSVAASPGYSLIKSYSTIDVGANVTAWTGFQDRDGVLYFGTNSLVSFDGTRWRSFPLGNGYGLRALDLGKDGRLWAGGIGELGWFQRDGTEWSFHSLVPKLPGGLSTVGEIWHVFSTDEGAVFFSDERIFRWDGAAFQTWEMPESRHLRGFRIDGTIYFQHPPTGLYRLDPNGPTLIESVASLSASSIMLIIPQGEDWTLVMHDGILLRRGGQVVGVDCPASTYLRAHPVSMAVLLPNGHIATGSVNDGLTVWSHSFQKIAAYSESEGINARHVQPILVDRHGALWSSSTAAIYRIALNSASTFFDQKAGLPTQPINAIVRFEDQLTIATSDGVMRLSPLSRQFEPLPSTPLFTRDLSVMEDGLLMAGYRGLSRSSGGKVARVFETEADVLTLGRSYRAPGTVYGDRRRDVLAFSPGRAPKVVVAGLPVAATSIVEAHDNTLWMGTRARGLFVATLSDAPATPGLPPAHLGLPSLSGATRVAAIGDGGLVVVSESGGWIRRAGAGSFVPIEQFPARPIGTIASAFGRDGTLWVVHGSDESHRAVAAQITLTDRGARWQPHAIEGLSDVGTPRSVLAEKLRDGSTALWIGGSDGLVRNVITDGPVAPVPTAPLVHMAARLQVGGRVAAVATPLPHSVQTIVFEFSAPDVMRFPLRIESRIDGIDSDWVQAMAGRRELPATRDGRYALRVRVVAETGATSPEVVLPFEILPPWWRTPLALIGFVLALVPIGYGFYRLRIRSLRLRNAQLELKVRERTEELVQANAAKTQFVANMSHDIRNPLNGIVGLALALEDSKLDASQRQVVATLRECTTYLSTLVDDVLDFASIEAGKIEVRPGPFAPPELLRSIVATLKADTASCGASLTVVTATQLPPQIVGDAGRIQQILVNFVSNALKYAGGHIQILATEPADAPGEIEFAVSDQGPGLSAAEQASLFTKFTRIKRAHGAEPIPGTGLGLASCRLMADLMGGSVGVQSEPGRGARFFLRLPLIVATGTAPVPAGSLPNSAVLLVEDADYNAWAAEAVLARLGLACERAHNGEEALRLFAAKRFNVVLLDRNLPDLDGTEVARRMRAMESGSTHAVLLAVTAYCTAEDRTLCLEAGMDAFVGKPLTPEKLRKALLTESRRLLTGATVQAQPASQTAAPEELDLTLLAYLSDGSPAGLDAQVNRFNIALEEAERQLSALFPREDFAAVAATAHFLLSQARMVGSTPLSLAAIQLEAAARAKDRAACGATLARLSQEIQTLKAAMRHRRSALSA